MKTSLGKLLWLGLTVAVLWLSAGSARGDTIYVWSDDGTIKQFATNGTFVVLTNGFSGWNGPVGLTTDAWGNLFAGIPGTSEIWKFAPDSIPSLVSFAVDSISALAFDATGTLYTTIPNYCEVDRLCGPPYYLCNLWPSNYSNAHLSYPTGLAFDRAGNFFVANNVAPYPFSSGRYTNTIEMFSPAIAHLGTFATNLNKPWGLAFGNAGNLFVSNSGTNGVLKNTIVKFTPEGVRSTFASSGLSKPQGLAFDSAGNLFVANAGSGTILKFTPGGGSSTFASGLDRPSSIAIHPGIKFWKATAIRLTNSGMLPGGAFQFNFENTPTVGFSALATTNLSIPTSNWVTLGRATETSPGHFQFADPQATNTPQRFYRVSSP